MIRSGLEMKILVVDACMRGESSRTRRLYEKLLECQAKDYDIEVLKLAEEKLLPMSGEETEVRAELVDAGMFEHPVFDYANQFKNADCIIVAAPYWDLSFPSVLKVYFEHISVAGITFGYEGADCVGYCKAKKLIYLSTCGGFLQGGHLGAMYVKALAEMFGIYHFEEFAVEGLDIDPTQVERLMSEGFERMLSKISVI